MKRQIKENVFLWLICFVSLSYGLVFLGCDGSPDRQEPPTAEIDRERGRLLTFAFDTALAIPMEPHHKDRAKAQQAVVEACIETGQISRAVEYARRIDSWRRGVAMGELAFHMAGNGERDLAESYLEDASRVATMYKGWRKDRIRIRIARTRALLGKMNEAREQIKTSEEIEKPRLSGVSSGELSDNEFQAKLKELNEWVGKGDFDVNRSVLDSVVELLQTEYDTKERREALFATAAEASKKMPVFVRIDILLRMAEIAVKHEHISKARELIEEAQEYVDGATWPLRHGVQVKARVAKARFMAGDQRQARNDVDTLFKEYQKNGAKIVNIYRAETLRPIAEAYQEMGDREMARTVYSMAVEEGVANPNSRPRAIDLAGTCCSMAVHGFMPNPELWARMKEIRNGLSDPW